MSDRKPVRAPSQPEGVTDVLETAVAALARAGRRVAVLRPTDRPTVVLPFQRPTR